MEGPKNSDESEERLQGIVIEGLQRALLVHDQLGAAGEEPVRKNEFGDTALRVDVACEKAILDFLRETRIPIRVISEEHGQVDIGEHPRYVGILDGLDGSSAYKKERGRARYGTMFGIFNGLDPKYRDYVASGIMEQPTQRLFFARKGRGAFVATGNIHTPIHSSGRTHLDTETRIYIDEYFKINRETFSDKLRTVRLKPEAFSSESSAVYYADVACGAADLALECTRKNNLEIAVAYGLEREAGAVMVDLEGVDIGDKKYLEFGQQEKIPIITAATRELAKNLIRHNERVMTDG